MPTSASRKNHPISMRLPSADIAVIDRAALLRGRSRTDFVREAAVRAAEDALLENRTIVMSTEGFSAFVAAIAGPAAIVPEIAALTQHPAPWKTAGDPEN